MREPEYFQPLMTTEEYFEMEANAEVKHELWWGVPCAMAGARPSHVVVAKNALRAIDGRLDGTPCQAGASDLRVAINDAANYVYPDVVVWCEDAQWNGRGDTLLTPIVIVEVLSPGTQLRDRREKLDAYRDLPSLRDYLMIAPERVSVEHYARTDEAEVWRNRHSTRRAQRIRLATLDLEIEVAEFYRRLDVPEGLRAVAPAVAPLKES